jgi:hypothetical protein
MELIWISISSLVQSTHYSEGGDLAARALGAIAQLLESATDGTFTSHGAVRDDPIVRDAIAAYRLKEEATLKLKVQRLVAVLFCATFLAALIAKLSAGAAASVSRPGAFRWLFLVTAVLASIYISIDVWYDFVDGSTSSFSRAGAHVVASTTSPFFWIIVATKSLAAVFITAVALKLARGSR